MRERAYIIYTSWIINILLVSVVLIQATDGYLIRMGAAHGKLTDSRFESKFLMKKDDLEAVLPDAQSRFVPQPTREASPDNPFAQIIARKLPAVIVFEDEELVCARCFATYVGRSRSVTTVVSCMYAVLVIRICPRQIIIKDRCPAAPLHLQGYKALFPLFMYFFPVVLAIPLPCPILKFLRCSALVLNLVIYSSRKQCRLDSIRIRSYIYVYEYADTYIAAVSRV